ncbi:MAG: hypothetical protein IJ491_08175 [Clostridia bacterium]|nr:hypothetical protein [Clostridia bacterium]
MKNYLTYPFKVMRITQSYTGTVSHKPHTTGSPKDYPIDEACTDSGKEALYCPCDKMKLIIKYGQGNGGTNTLFLQSTSKVYFADGTSDFFSMQVTHPDDSDLKKLRKGQKFKRGELICREGKDGATGNHLHISGGKGKIRGNGWVKNSNGKWVLNPTKGAYKPEKLFFIDPAFTKILNSKGLTFTNLPEEKYKTGTYKVSSADVLHVRKGPGIEYGKKKFYSLTYSARKQIRELTGKKADGYVRGVVFTVSEICGNWGKSPSGWVCLDYCEKL